MKLFEHPTKVCMTYVEHMLFSLYLSYSFLKASICAFCHAVYPDVFITHSSDTLTTLLADIKDVGCRKSR